MVSLERRLLSSATCPACCCCFWTIGPSNIFELHVRWPEVVLRSSTTTCLLMTFLVMLRYQIICVASKETSEHVGGAASEFWWPCVSWTPRLARSGRLRGRRLACLLCYPVTFFVMLSPWTRWFAHHSRMAMAGRKPSPMLGSLLWIAFWSAIIAMIMQLAGQFWFGAKATSLIFSLVGTMLTASIAVSSPSMSWSWTTCGGSASSTSSTGPSSAWRTTTFARAMCRPCSD